MSPLIFLLALLVGILADAYTTKIGLALGFQEQWPLFKGRPWKTILAIKLAGFLLLAWGVWAKHWSEVPTPWALFLGALIALQFYAAWLNWSKIKARRRQLAPY